jgi:hypothetical protein
VKDLEKKLASVPSWSHAQLVKLCQDLLQQNVALQHQVSAARELLNEYRRGLK